METIPTPEGSASVRSRCFGLLASCGSIFQAIWSFCCRILTSCTKSRSREEVELDLELAGLRRLAAEERDLKPQPNPQEADGCQDASSEQDIEEANVAQTSPLYSAPRTQESLLANPSHLPLVQSAPAACPAPLALQLPDASSSQDDAFVADTARWGHQESRRSGSSDRHCLKLRATQN
uniref:Uncharacterized protein n=1 Tax=Noctiluca scintillans TaxID=2966 RepID=A0A7S1F1H3_NOCSC|mmetsp:Transcript_24838/g.65247  ORF Transcript_24838/g.65247 Transcript_24838/m.65247 type:complete len:179 (+) Transcript_24838:41-577(+)